MVQIERLRYRDAIASFAGGSAGRDRSLGIL
jgi:hypothetical protein